MHVGFLPHVHDGAPVFERDFVHYGLHEVNTATVRQKPIVGRCRIGYRGRVKPLSFVAHRDRDFSVHIAAAGHIDVLAGILTIAVDDGICKGFTKRRLNLALASIRLPEAAHKPHDLVYGWRDGLDLTWKRLVQFYKSSRMNSSRRKVQSSRMSHTCDLCLKCPRPHRSSFCIVSSSARQTLLNSRKGSARL